jgi:uncharacterized repeat protein (TIGR01451 family)
LSGQDGEEILGGGLDIGSIAPGGDTQGGVVVAFKVSSTVVPQLCMDVDALNYRGALPCVYPQPTYCTISTFRASPASITSGDSSTLSWNTTDCNSVSISTIGNVNPSDSRVVSPTQTTTYILTAGNGSGAGSTQTRSATVTVSPVMPQLCNDPSATNYRGALPCVYAQKYTLTVSKIGTGEGDVRVGPTSTSIMTCGYNCTDVYQYNSNTYVVLTATPVTGSIFNGWSGACSGTGSCSLTMNANKSVNAVFNEVVIPPQRCQDPAASNYLGALPCTYPQLCRDVSASNYLGALPCTYPAQLCRDTAASNYLGALPCTYPAQLCRDTTASNYLGALPCTYPQLCRDTTASNYLGALPCTYPAQLCRDTAASNYLGNLPCRYTPIICQDPTASNYRKSEICDYPPVYNTCKVNSFTASDTSIEDGDSVTLYWNTTNCNSIYISGIGNVSSTGSRKVYPNNTTTYNITASGNNGSDSDSVKVYVDENNNGDKCTITNFDADDTSVSDGDTVKLEWDTDNCDSVSISGVASGLDDSGTYRVYPTYTRTYTINAYGNNGSDSDSVKIYVDEDNTDENNCSIDSFTSSDTNISQGDSSTLKWRTTDCNDVTISSIGDVSDDGSEVVYPYNTTTYTLRAYGDNNGTRTKTLTVYVDSDPIIYVNKNVVTTVATNITRGEAQVNGYITNTSYYNSNVYFEYGTTVNLGSRTPSKSTNGNSSFSSYLTGLSPNTVYFFQAVGEGSNGVSRGSVEVFKTLADTIVRPIIIQGQTIIGKESPIMLEISNKYQLIGKDDLVDYTVTYKNIGNARLTNPMVQVVIPANMTLVNASRGTYSVDTNTLSAAIEDLEKGQEGVIYLQVKVNSIPQNNAQIVTTAILVYTSSNGAQENAMAYVMNTPKTDDNGSLLGASAFFGGFLSIGLLGWLLIILVILILILIARSFYTKEQSQINANNQTH